MVRSKRRQTNELEFQGEVIVWLNDAINARHRHLVHKATQEKPRVTSGKRSDLIVWTNRNTENAFIAIELKTPSTPINDPDFICDAVEKAHYWKAGYVAVWNMREFEVYQTTPSGDIPLPHHVIERSKRPLSLNSVEEWLKPSNSKNLQKAANTILDSALVHSELGDHAGHTIDAEIFVERLTESINNMKLVLYGKMK